MKVERMAILPALSILALAVVALLPWSGGDTARFALAMMPVLAIRFWSQRHPSAVPAVLAFATGLLLDVVSFGPLGFWALIALAALGLARFEAALFPDAAAALSVTAFLLSNALLAALAWALSSIYFNRLLPWQPPVLGALTAAAAYPLIWLVLGSLGSKSAAPRGNLFVRGR